MGAPDSHLYLPVSVEAATVETRSIEMATPLRQLACRNIQKTFLEAGERNYELGTKRSFGKVDSVGWDYPTPTLLAVSKT